jgi:multimeric flavodoxin WrbA
MKVIGINASPRKHGNTETLIQTVLDAAAQKGYETERFDLNTMSYKGCQACMWCKTHGHCKLSDDLTKVLDGIKDADAVVFGSPIYFAQLTGQFRMFQDRLYSFVGPDFKVSLKPGKKAVVITAQGNPDANAFKAAPDALTASLKMLGFSVVDTILLEAGNSPSAAKDRKDLLDRAAAAGASL